MAAFRRPRFGIRGPRFCASCAGASAIGAATSTPAIEGAAVPDDRPRRGSPTSCAARSARAFSATTTRAGGRAAAASFRSRSRRPSTTRIADELFVEAPRRFHDDALRPDAASPMGLRISETCVTKETEANEVDTNQEETVDLTAARRLRTRPVEIRRKSGERLQPPNRWVQGRPEAARDQLNLHLQRSYYLTFYYKQNPEEYAEFQRQPYFSDIRQKTRVRSISFRVLMFTMQAKGNNQRLNRIYKRERVLEYLLTQVVLPEHVAEYLKREGGVDHIYESLNAAKKRRRRKMFADEHQIDRGDADLAEIVSARSGDDKDQCAMSDESAAADHGLATASSNQRKIHEVSRERNNPFDSGLALSDARRELIVEMDPLDLERVRNSVGGQIRQDLPVNPIGCGFTARF